MSPIHAYLDGTIAQCQIVDVCDGESPPILEIRVGTSNGRTALEICSGLRNGTPPIYVGHGKLDQGKLVVHPLCLTEDDAEQVGLRLREELER